MPISERFGSGLKMVLGVQARIISGITTLTVNDVQIRRSNLGPERNCTVELLVDSDTLDFTLSFTDDTLEHRTITGGPRARFETEVGI